MKLASIAQTLGCPLSAAASDIEITRIAPPQAADKSCITFVAREEFFVAAQQSEAVAVIVKRGKPVAGKISLEVDDPYVGYARVAQLFEDCTFLFDGPIHPTAFIDPSARVSATACVGPFTVIGRHCAVGERTRINAHCVLENGVRIGDDCLVNSTAVICRECIIGNRVIIEAGAVIGSEGFGNARDGEAWVRIPSLGTVVVEDDVWIGANVAIDRGALGSTVIRRGARIDNLVHIAHNVEVGENCAFAAQVGVSGSTTFGKGVIVGGQAGFVGHISVGENAFIGAQAGVSKSVAPNCRVTGYPARDLMQQRRIDAALRQLPELIKEVRYLKKVVSDLVEKKGNGNE